MAETQSVEGEVKEIVTPKPGEFIARLQGGVNLGRLRGAGSGIPSPLGAEVDIATGEVTPPPKETPKEPPKEEEPEVKDVKEEEKSDALAAIDRLGAYLARVRRQITS